MRWPFSSTSSKSLCADRRPSWNFPLRISRLWPSGCRRSSFPSCLLAIRRVQQRTCVIVSVVIPTTMKTRTYCRCTQGNNVHGELGFFEGWMWWYIILLELVSKSCRTIEESSLDEVDETWVEVDLDIGKGVFDHPDRLGDKSQIIYWEREERTYLAVFICRPVPRIYIHIVLDQRLDTLWTSITNAELENCDLVRRHTTNLSTVMW